MNAVAEMTTAQAVADSEEVRIIAIVRNAFFPKVALSHLNVVVSALRVLSQGSHSISAVAPDTNFLIGGLPLGNYA